jgi:putative Mg2+ transporter-C (MgtC) family protein
MMTEILENNHFLTTGEVNKFLLTILLCGLIGAEREFRGKQAGLKTIIMMGLGATLFTILSIKIGAGSQDRIASNIVTGIGFLGAGVIFKDDNQVKGLTTASVIWIVAAIGMAVGSGYYIQAVVVTVVVLIALLVFPYLEDMVEKRITTRTYRIVKIFESESMDKYEDYIKTSGLKFIRGRQQLRDEKISGVWIVTGNPKNHKKFVDRMLLDDKVISFDF